MLRRAKRAWRLGAATHAGTLVEQRNNCRERTRLGLRCAAREVMQAGEGFVFLVWVEQGTIPSVGGSKGSKENNQMILLYPLLRGQKPEDLSPVINLRTARTCSRLFVQHSSTANSRRRKKREGRHGGTEERGRTTTRRGSQRGETNPYCIKPLSILLVIQFIYTCILLSHPNLTKQRILQNSARRTATCGSLSFVLKFVDNSHL